MVTLGIFALFPAMKTKVEPNEKRYPTTKWAGNYFSESMPAGGKEPVQSPTSPSAMPQGLSSINRVSVHIHICTL